MEKKYAVLPSRDMQGQKRRQESRSIYVHNRQTKVRHQRYFRIRSGQRRRRNSDGENAISAVQTVWQTKENLRQSTNIVTKLKTLTLSCEWGEIKDDLICGRIVSGIVSTRVQERLL